MSKEYQLLSSDEGGASFPPQRPWSLNRVLSGRKALQTSPKTMIFIMIGVLGLGIAGSLVSSVRTTRCETIVVETAPSIEEAPRLLVNASLEETRPPPLSKLGYLADDTYELLSPDEYESTLRDFIRQVMPASMHAGLLSSLESFPSPLRPIPEVLFQTDKERPSDNAWDSWRNLNPNISIEFFDDEQALQEVIHWFGDGEITQVYKSLSPVVLKADLLRYLLLLLRGGVYDVDTTALKPIAKFGHIDEKEAASGNSSNHGQIANMVVGIEADVDDNGFDFMGKFWDDGLSRPLQIVQWTMTSSACHPIFIDTVRRIVEKTRYIEQWKRRKQHELKYLGDTEAAKRLREEKPWQQINYRFDRAICDWTGPGVFTDSVMSYLARISDTTWPRFHGIPWGGESVYIGDIKVGPFCTYRPYEEHKELPQALVQHHFANKWLHEHEKGGDRLKHIKRGHSAHDECELRHRTNRP